MTARSTRRAAGRLRAMPIAAIAAIALGLLSSPPAGAGPSQPPAGPWQAATYRVAGKSPVLVRTMRSNGWPAYVAWIDHTLTRLALYPGLQEPPSTSIRGSGSVPQGQRWRLLATFNGGFKAATGAGGFVVNGRVDQPLLNGRGTLVATRDGELAILDWLGRTNPAKLVLARQNLAPLVWNRRPSASVGAVGLWGATLGGGAAVWRTAVGVTASGDLVYAAAAGQTPAALADLMIRAGAARAIELDINPQWPSFITYRKRGGRDPLAFVPNPQQSAYRYLSPDNRDFFAVYTRAGGGPLVPFR